MYRVRTNNDSLTGFSHYPSLVAMVKEFCYMYTVDTQYSTWLNDVRVPCRPQFDSNQASLHIWPDSLCTLRRVVAPYIGARIVAHMENRIFKSSIIRIGSNFAKLTVRRRLRIGCILNATNAYSNEHISLIVIRVLLPMHKVTRLWDE